jgi:hypothetical protein
VAKELETVLADAFAEADIVARSNSSISLDRFRAILADVRTAAEPYTTWLSETDAAIRRGVTPATMASYFPAMERDENARLVGRQRQYRQCAVPRRANTEAAAARARAAARQEKKSA